MGPQDRAATCWGMRWKNRQKKTQPQIPETPQSSFQALVELPCVGNVAVGCLQVHSACRARHPRPQDPTDPTLCRDNPCTGQEPPVQPVGNALQGWGQRWWQPWKDPQVGWAGMY